MFVWCYDFFSLPFHSGYAKESVPSGWRSVLFFLHCYSNLLATVFSPFLFFFFFFCYLRCLSRTIVFNSTDFLHKYIYIHTPYHRYGSEYFWLGNFSATDADTMECEKANIYRSCAKARLMYWFSLSWEKWNGDVVSRPAAVDVDTLAFLAMGADKSKSIEKRPVEKDDTVLTNSQIRAICMQTNLISREVQRRHGQFLAIYPTGRVVKSEFTALLQKIWPAGKVQNFANYLFNL